MTFNDFHTLAKGNDYNDLFGLYTSVKAMDPSFELPEGHLNVLGLQLVFGPNTGQQGIKVLLLAVRCYPNSSNLFDSLGEAYLFLGNKEEAKKNFAMALLLNPQNQNAKIKLQQLRL